MWHRFPLPRPLQGIHKVAGGGRAPATHPGTAVPQGLRRNLSCIPPRPSTQACLHARPGLALRPHTSLHSAGPRKEGPEPSLSWGSHTLGEGWVHKATGYSVQHYLPSQKAGTALTSINRRLGEDTLAQPHRPHVAAGEEWEGPKQILKADVCEAFDTWSGPLPSVLTHLILTSDSGGGTPIIT